MGLSVERDFVTYPVLGNTGSVALPLSLAAAAASGTLQAGDRLALLGIGSGINSVMLGATWQQTQVDAGAIGKVVQACS
jgi:3-oxoacyl-[acyl-carrier-protein] synthase-3